MYKKKTKNEIFKANLWRLFPSVGLSKQREKQITRALSMPIQTPIFSRIPRIWKLYGWTAVVYGRNNQPEWWSWNIKESVLFLKAKLFRRKIRFSTLERKSENTQTAFLLVKIEKRNDNNNNNCLTVFEWCEILTSWRQSG